MRLCPQDICPHLSQAGEAEDACVTLQQGGRTGKRMLWARVSTSSGDETLSAVLKLIKASGERKVRVKRQHIPGSVTANALRQT